ncbi:MAG: TIGR00296 family protein [Elusimicrobia bacterium]|nr:TIGR00296 family protein [Elusimicrobiota bacterium]
MTEIQKQKLLRIARETLECFLSGRKLAALVNDDPVFQERRGVFVTLKKKDELRGCIGYIEGVGPLAEAVRKTSIQSATEDSRFPSVEYSELEDITIEISVLTPLKRVEDAGDIQLGRDGVIIKKGYRTGVFLPQVADETGWTKDEFLSNLCMYKAGLPADAWQDKETEIYIFQADVFSE